MFFFSFSFQIFTHNFRSILPSDSVVSLQSCDTEQIKCKKTAHTIMMIKYRQNVNWMNKKTHTHNTELTRINVVWHTLSIVVTHHTVQNWRNKWRNETVCYTRDETDEPKPKKRKKENRMNSTAHLQFSHCIEWLLSHQSVIDSWFFVSVFQWMLAEPIWWYHI